MRPKASPKCYPRGAYMFLRDPDELRQRIDARELSIREFAALADLSSGFVSHLLPPRSNPEARPRKRTCSPEVARRIARAARCSVPDLFDTRYDDVEDSTHDTGSFRTPSASTVGSHDAHRRSA